MAKIQKEYIQNAASKNTAAKGASLTEAIV